MYDKNTFKFVRSETRKPVFMIDQQYVDFDARDLSEEDSKKYTDAQSKLDSAIGAVAESYIKDPNPKQNLLEFSRKCSQKYFQLYEAYCHMHETLGVPSIKNVYVGMLKQVGLSHREVLFLNELSKNQDYLGLDKAIMEQDFIDKNDAWKIVIETEIDPEIFAKYPEHTEFLQSIRNLFTKLDPQAIKIIRKLHSISKVRDIDYDQLSIKIITMNRMPSQAEGQRKTFLVTLSEMANNFGVATSDRFIQEIHQRIIDPEATLHFGNRGSLGSNPLSIINVLKKGELGYEAAEFHSRMYFVYMSNDFANEIISLETRELTEINNYLQLNYGWQIDNDVMNYLKQRRQDLSEIPPIFRYGDFADLNTQGIRTRNSREYIQEATKALPKTSSDHLSAREKMAFFGDSTYSGNEQLTYDSGITKFSLLEAGTTEPAAQYIDICKKFGFKVISGISGTQDQTTSMLALVGMINSEEDLLVSRLSLLAFMVPNQDHSSHEILQPSQSYGLKYTISPLIHTTVLDENFAKKVEDHLSKTDSSGSLKTIQECVSLKLESANSLQKQTYKYK